jgi:hypothetical protein
MEVCLWLAVVTILLYLIFLMSVATDLAEAFPPFSSACFLSFFSYFDFLSSHLFSLEYFAPFFLFSSIFVLYVI